MSQKGSILMFFLIISRIKYKIESWKFYEKQDRVLPGFKIAVKTGLEIRLLFLKDVNTVFVITSFKVPTKIKLKHMKAKRSPPKNKNSKI